MRRMFSGKLHPFHLAAGFLFPALQDSKQGEFQISAACWRWKRACGAMRFAIAPLSLDSALCKANSMQNLSVCIGSSLVWDVPIKNPYIRQKSLHYCHHISIVNGYRRLMELLALQHFMGRVNEMFLAVLNDGKVPFQRVEAGALPVHSAAMPRMRLSLLFRNTSLSLFPQQIYRLRYAVIGKGAGGAGSWRFSVPGTVFN